VVITDSGQDLVTLLDSLPDVAQEGGAGDAAPDLPDSQPPLPDLAPPDSVGWDTAPSPGTAIYAVTKNTSSFGLRTVSTNGTAKPAPLPGYSGLLKFDALSLNGLQEYIPVNRHRPRPTQEHYSGFQGIKLPGKLGTLYYFHDMLKITSGLLLVPAAGKGLKRLVEVPGVYADTLSKYITLSPDGKIGALVQGGAKVLLFRTDGTNFATGKPWVEVKSPAIPSIKTFRERSLTIAGNVLYCTALDTSSQYHLLWTSLSGGSPLAAVTLPQGSGGKPATAINDHLVVSRDGFTMLVAAGSLSTFQDLYRLDLKTTKTTLVSSTAGYISSRGDSFGSLGAQVALSPKGTRAAFVRTETGIPELNVIDTTGGAKPVQITGDTRFKSTVSAIYNLHFSDENNLIFMAGDSAYTLDIYHWDHQQSKAHNLTTQGSTSPFDGQGSYYPQGGWISPNYKWLYLIGYDYYTTRERNIFGVDLSSHKVVAITTKGAVKASADGFATCAGKDNVYLSMELVPGKYQSEIFIFNQNLGHKAAQLTSMTKGYSGSWFNYNLTLDEACSRLTWTAGGSYWLQDVHYLKTSSPLKTYMVTPLSLYISPGFGFTPDNKTVLFGSGGSTNTATLKAMPLPGGKLTTLDSAAGYVHVFTVY